MTATVKTALSLLGLAVALAALNYQPTSSESPLVASLASDSLSPDQPSDDGPGDLITPPEAAGSLPPSPPVAPVDIEEPLHESLTVDFEIPAITDLKADLADLQARYDALLAEKVALEAKLAQQKPAQPVAAQPARTTYGTYYQSCGPGGCQPQQYYYYPQRRGLFGGRR